MPGLPPRQVAAVGQQATAYVYRNGQCNLTVTDASAILKELDSLKGK